MVRTGLLKLIFYGMKHSFYSLYGNAVFSSTMSLNLFKFLLAHLRFDDKATREEHWKQDRFAAIRDIVQIFAENCERVFASKKYLSLNKTMYSTRVRGGIWTEQ